MRSPLRAGSAKLTAPILVTGGAGFIGSQLGALRMLRAKPIDKPSAGLDPNPGRRARSSSAALALPLFLSLTLVRPNASPVSQPNGIGGPYQNPEPPSTPSAPA